MDTRTTTTTKRLVFDIGAYVGEKTAQFLQDGSCVIAVEPHPDSAKYLREQFKDKNVIVVEKAVSDKIGRATLYTPSCNLQTLSTLVPKAHFKGRFETVTIDKKISVKTTTLDALIRTYGVPAFIKVDVESSEPMVLKGLSHRVPLSFEYTQEFIDNLELCLTTLSKLGSYTCAYSHGDLWTSAFMAPDKLLEAIKSDSGSWGDVYVKWD